MNKNKLLVIICLVLCTTMSVLSADAKRKSDICFTFNFANSLWKKIQNSYTAEVKFVNQTHLYRIDLVTRPENELGYFLYNVSVPNSLGTLTRVATNFQGHASINDLNFSLPGISACVPNIVFPLLPIGILSCSVGKGTGESYVGICNQLLSAGDTVDTIEAKSSAISMSAFNITLTPN